MPAATAAPGRRGTRSPGPAAAGPAAAGPAGAPFADRRPPGPLRIGLLVPQSGPIGLFGPSSIACARLAAQEINRTGGVLGRPVELVLGDAGGGAAEVVARTEEMLAAGVEAVVGCHVSPNRLALVEAIGGRVPYVYTTLYEGGQYSFGVFVCGETPEQQLEPLLHWLTRHRFVRRWYLIGNDYVFPRTSLDRARRWLQDAGSAIAGEEYLPLGVEDFSPSLDRIAASGADAVLIYLVGTDSILFNRRFGARGLHDRVLRAGPVLCENALLGIGTEGTRNLWSATGYANSRPDRAGEAFRDGYARSFGPLAPVPNRFSVSCYEGTHLLARLAARAGSLDVFRMQLAAPGLPLQTPRGACRLKDNHLVAPVHIATAAGTDLQALDCVGPRAAAIPVRPIWPRDRGTA